MQAGGILQDVELGELHHGVGGLVHEPAHADVVLDLGLGEEGRQRLARARLDPLEGFSQRRYAGRHIEGAIGKLDAVGRVKPDEVVEFLHSAPEVGKVAVEDVGHPVPAGPHIEPESLGVKAPCATTGNVVLLVYRDVEPGLGQGRSRGQSGETGTDDGNVGRWWILGHACREQQAGCRLCSTANLAE